MRTGALDDGGDILPEAIGLLAQQRIDPRPLDVMKRRSQHAGFVRGEAHQGCRGAQKLGGVGRECAGQVPQHSLVARLIACQHDMVGNAVSIHGARGGDQPFTECRTKRVAPFLARISHAFGELAAFGVRMCMAGCEPGKMIQIGAHESFYLRLHMRPEFGERRDKCPIGINGLTPVRHVKLRCRRCRYDHAGSA